MYEEFFGLRERPFELTPNPRYLVLTEGHREALSNLQYAIAGRKGIALLVGEAGVGKTTVIRAALERQRSQVTCVHLENPSLTREEFVEMLAARFDLSERARASKAALLLELEALLQQRRALGHATVLVIDEAQSLSHELLEEVRLLANIETDDAKLMTLVIAGQPELAERLEDRRLRQLQQRIALRCELPALRLDETMGYVVGRIRAAGGEAARTFTREAVTLIHERAAGIPRAVNVLADNALLAGFARGERPVTRAVVSEVAQEFRIGGVPAPLTAPPPAPAPGLADTAARAAAEAAPDSRGAARDSAAERAAAGAAAGGRSIFSVFTARRRRFGLLNRSEVA